MSQKDFITHENKINETTKIKNRNHFNEKLQTQKLNIKRPNKKKCILPS